MVIRVSENINLSRPEQYVFIIEVCAEQFSFFLYNPDNPTERFCCQIPVDKSSTLSQFQGIFFDNDFFACPFRKIFIVNHTPVFTYIPNALFEEKNKDDYMRFLFTTMSGKILHQTLSNPEITILHTIAEDLYDFLQRSFPTATIMHHTAATIACCQKKTQLADGNRMVIYPQSDGVDVLCFSRGNLLLSNHFDCQSVEDAVYYALYTYKQLKFSQSNDFVYLVKGEKELQEKLRKYIRNVVPVRWEIWDNENC